MAKSDSIKRLKNTSQSQKYEFVDSNWFWRIATKWYFFPAFYLMLIMISMLLWYIYHGITHISDLLGMFIYGTFILPIFLTFIFPDLGLTFNSILFHALFVLTILMIMRYKSLHDTKTGVRNLKIIIITVILLMLILFSIGFVFVGAFIGR